MTFNRRFLTKRSFAAAIFLLATPLVTVYAQTANCDTREGIGRVEELFSEKVAEITKAQLAQVEEIRAIMRERGESANVVGRSMEKCCCGVFVI